GNDGLRAAQPRRLRGTLEDGHAVAAHAGNLAAGVSWRYLSSCIRFGREGLQHAIDRCIHLLDICCLHGLVVEAQMHSLLPRLERLADGPAALDENIAAFRL